MHFQTSNICDYILAPVWQFLTSPVGNIVVILGGLGWLAAVVFLPRVESAAVMPLAQTDKTWCDKIVEEDAKRMTERVMVVSWEPQPHFLENEPYVDFKLTFVNATVFRLISQKIDGETYYGRSPLAQHARLIDAPFALLHGDKKWLTIRQPLSRETANVLASARGLVKLDFSRVCITFNVLESLPNAPDHFSWFGKDDVIVASRD
jgi:hypothetical protein